MYLLIREIYYWEILREIFYKEILRNIVWYFVDIQFCDFWGEKCMFIGLNLYLYSLHSFYRMETFRKLQLYKTYTAIPVFFGTHYIL
jgi:hypothetical protein